MNAGDILFSKWHWRQPCETANTIRPTEIVFFSNSYDVIVLHFIVNLLLVNTVYETVNCIYSELLPKVSVLKTCYLEKITHWMLMRLPLLL